MPTVNGVQYPYTPEGIQAAANARAQLESAARAPVTLEAEPQVRYRDIMMEAARAGALGGAIGGGVARQTARPVVQGVRDLRLEPHERLQPHQRLNPAGDAPIGAPFQSSQGEGLKKVGPNKWIDLKSGDVWGNSDVNESALLPESTTGRVGRFTAQPARGLPPGWAPPTRMSRLGSALRSGARGALGGAVGGAVGGALVGAGSAAAGYRSAAPPSAGRFTAPGPGYEGVRSQAEIGGIADQGELQRQRDVAELIDEVTVRYGPDVAAQLLEEAGGHAGEALRPTHFADLLGPVRP